MGLYGINRTTRGPIDYIPSICYLMPRELWAHEAGFDPKYPGAYEDVDMGVRLGRSRLQVDPHAWVTHRSNSTLQYTPADRWRFKKGRIRLAHKHYGSAMQALAHIAP